MARIGLMVIDPQNDFSHPDGSLYVTGGDEDMKRLGAFIKDASRVLSSIVVTLDSHHPLDISHGVWFRDENGDEAPPFSVVAYDESNDCFVGTLYDPATGNVVSSRKLQVRPVGAEPRRHTIAYLKALSDTGRYPHVIWPPHCLIGSWGYGIHEDVRDAVYAWERDRLRSTTFVTKGSNPFVEHFSAVQAEVPRADDPSTGVNLGFVRALENHDLLFVAGEALSHCVAHTVRDAESHFSGDTLQKLVLLRDCTSPVPGFEDLGDAFLKEMTAKGMKVMTTDEARKNFL